MDAQNAPEAASTKPSASSTSAHSSSRLAPDSERLKVPLLSAVKPSGTSRHIALPVSRDSRQHSASSSPPAAASQSKEPSKDTAKEPSRESGKGLSIELKESRELAKGPPCRAPSPAPKDDKTHASTSKDKQYDESGGTDGNSEAETIVLSKDGSPTKPRNRKLIKHEDRRTGDATSSTANHQDTLSSDRKHTSDKRDPHPSKGEKASSNAATVDKVSAVPSLHKKKRLQERQSSNGHGHLLPGHRDASRGRSSAPASPPHSRQHSSNPLSGSDSERGRSAKSPKPLSSKDKIRLSDKHIPSKRKAPKADSDDEAEIRKARRQRLSGPDGMTLSSKSSKDQHHNAGNSKQSSRTHDDSSRNRSISPQPRAHRRSHSSQLPPQSNGLGLKKKRIPAPLQSTDYRSDESSASNSPHIRSSKPRGLATPATANSTISPAKTAPHKKHLDAHGQTYLARACARGEYDTAKARLMSRPEDLNVADFAGNTPLQIASLNGYGNIVKLLIDAGCNYECVNHDKETPLLDAVDNGHLEVVKLLLDAGVNPRKANLNGEEPLDRVTDDIDNAAEIRLLLINARKKSGGRRLTSEEQRHDHDDTRSHANESPRRSPAPASGRRAGTIRANKTSNHLLYMPMDDKTLRLAAGRGDEETVTRILQVREAFDDPESMVAAARGGHETVMQLLLALGRANPDPQPIHSMPPEHATPMLAAIGQENINVVKLLLDQSLFDPTRKCLGTTYYEIARQRAGPNWKEEEDILKKAYDSYKKAHAGKEAKLKSPSRKDSEHRKAPRIDTDDEPASRAHKRKTSSPLQEKSKKPVTKPITLGTPIASRDEKSFREERLAQKRADQSAVHGDGKLSPKRSNGSGLPNNKHKRDDRSSVASGPELDTPPPPVKQFAKSKKSDAETVALSSEGETVKPRRKLISGRELKDEKEKQRRASLASAIAVPSKESSKESSKDSQESRQDDVASDKARAEKHRDRDRDRARQLKNEDARDSVSSSGDGSAKRHRQSETPPRHAPSDKDSSEAPIKRRRLNGESNSNGAAKERKASKASVSSDDVPAKSVTASLSRESSMASKAAPKRRDEEDRKTGTSSLLKAKKRDLSTDRARKVLARPPVIEKSIHVKSEDVDIEMTDVSADIHVAASSTTPETETRSQRDKAETKKAAQSDIPSSEAAKKKEEDANRLRLDEAKRKKEEEEDRRKRDEEKRKKEDDENRKRDEERRKREEEAAKRKEEEASKQRERERKKQEETEKAEKERRRQEEEDRKRKDEERKRKDEERKRKEDERRQREEEEERKRKEDEERKLREHEERLRQEQLEREAAEESRRRQDEAERKDRERRDQERRDQERREQERKEQERMRAREEAEEQRRREVEEERIRVATLPALLGWLTISSDAKSADIAKKFRIMQGVRYDCIDSSANGSTSGREQWLLNTQVALLFGDKDLDLSKFPAWQHAPASMIAKKSIWRLEADRYALTDIDLYDLGRQLPDYYRCPDPTNTSYRVLEELRDEAWARFAAMDMFFVKASDVMGAIPDIPHLRDVELVMDYRELPEDEAQLLKFAVTQKWKTDPDAERFCGFAPGKKYYKGGHLVREQLPRLCAVSKTPFPELRVPRRGYQSVGVGDPDFHRLCKEQGIDPATIVAAVRSPPLSNGVHSPKQTAPQVNGKGPHDAVHGDFSSPGRLTPSPEAQQTHPIANGVNGTHGTE